MNPSFLWGCQCCSPASPVILEKSTRLTNKIESLAWCTFTLLPVTLLALAVLRPASSTQGIFIPDPPSLSFCFWIYMEDTDKLESADEPNTI